MPLIVGLGNPGARYRLTRHNFGFKVVGRMAEKLGWDFKKERFVEGEVAQGVVGERQTFLLLPTTYMNLSGVALAQLLKKYRLPSGPKELLIIVDDVYVPFGKMRWRDGGSAGGHNGLKSIEEHLGTQEYPRLRLGIGPEGELEYGTLEAFVLEEFTPEEQTKLPALVEEAAEAILEWVKLT